MADWFDFAGTRSTTHGVYVQEYPPMTLPEERAKFETLPGRSGSLTLLESDAVYDDIVLSIDCFVRDLSKLDRISVWLRGRGALVLGNMPDRYYDARCVNQIELAKVLRGHQHRTFAAVFRCQPYRYLFQTVQHTRTLTAADTITNLGTVFSEPLITVTGTGDVALVIGDYGLTIEGLEADKPITVDCDAKLAVFADGSYATQKVTITDNQWPILVVGNTAISWTGSVTSVVIEPNWRDL